MKKIIAVFILLLTIIIIILNCVKRPDFEYSNPYDPNGINYPPYEVISQWKCIDIKYLAIDSNNYIYAARYTNITKYDGSGTYITEWGEGYGSGDGQFRYISGIVVDENGYVYVADSNNRRIQKFSSRVHSS